MFGEWTTKLFDLQNAFTNASPFQHVIINNFFSEDVAQKLHSEFPDPLSCNFDWNH